MVLIACKVFLTVNHFRVKTQCDSITKLKIRDVNLRIDYIQT